MGLKTPLHDAHVAAAARMMDFGGWEMPLNYGSQIEEHHAVRRDAGCFDVSHMLAVDLTGKSSREFLRTVLANDIARLRSPGQVIYSCMLNEAGGVIDDLLVYYVFEDRYRVVVNAGNRDKDLLWLRRHAAQFNVDVRPRVDLAVIAVQGPDARQKTAPLLGSAGEAALQLPPFCAQAFDHCFVARTGYTGEDGWEVMLPAGQALQFWSDLIEAGVVRCGLGARDTLRLEAGLNLYGHEMDETVSPLESGLAWTVDWRDSARNFIGREALLAQQARGIQRKLVGLVLDGGGVLRAQQRIQTPHGDGEVTSGTFSPTLQRSIGLARVPTAVQDSVEVDIRGRLLPARIVKYPFVRQGRSNV